LWKIIFGVVFRRGSASPVAMIRRGVRGGWRLIWVRPKILFFFRFVPPLTKSTGQNYFVPWSRLGAGSPEIVLSRSLTGRTGAEKKNFKFSAGSLGPLKNAPEPAPGQANPALRLQNIFSTRQS